MSTSFRPDRLIHSFSIPHWTVRPLLGCALAASILSGGSAGAEPGFLAGGGSVDSGGIYSGGSDAFLADGGSISIDRLDDGRHRRQRDFLQDGGSITSGAGRAFHRRGYQDHRRPDAFLKHGGSITTVYDVPARRGDDRPAISDHGQRTPPSDGVAFRGDDWDDDRPGLGGGTRAVASIGASSEPKIIDVESARLDRRPIGPGGIHVVHAGGAKIIRIAPDYRRQVASAERNEPMPRAAPLEPWSRQWLRHCMETYPSFDPNFGTYAAADGRNRFCTGE